MEDILKLIEIKRQRGHRSIQLLNQNFRKNEISKDNVLYEHIIENDLRTDEEAALIVFNADLNNRNYRNAKSKLRHKLFNHLYFLDYDKKEYTHYKKYEYESYHELHQARILMIEGATDLATKKLLYVLKLAKVCEVIDIVCQALVWLKEIYANQGKLSLYKEVGLASGYYLKFQEAIRESEELYFSELVLINKSFSAQIRALNQIPGSIEQIRKKSAEFNSTRIEVLALKLELLYNKIINNFSRLNELCHQIEDWYFHRKDGEIRVDLDRNNIFLTRLEAYFNLKEFEEGLKFADLKEKTFMPGSELWYDFYELRFIMAMYAGKFKLAAKYLRITKTDKRFNSLHEMDRERWKIYRGYLIYFNNEKLVRWGFNFNHFLNYKLDYPREYAGYSVAVLAIRFLYFLRDNDLKGLNLTLNEMDIYNSSHLDKRSNYRNSVFIRLLNLVPENDFNYESIQEKGEIYYKKLENTHIPQDNYAELEIYPFDRLWNEVLHILKTDKHYVHFKFYHLSTA